MIDLLTAIGSTLDINCTYGQSPDKPDNLITLNYTGGFSPRRSLGSSKPSIREPLFQVRVRNKSYEEGLSEIERCINVLNSLRGIFGQKTITKISQTSDIFTLGRDEHNRYMFTVNFVIQIDNEKEE